MQLESPLYEATDNVTVCISANMKVTFCLWLCSLQISAVVLLNITAGKNLLLEPQDSIETAQSLETTELPGLVNNKGQGFYRSDDGDDEVVDAEGELILFNKQSH